MVTTEGGLREALRAIMASSVVGCDIETYAEPGQVDATVAEAVMQRAQERTPTGRAKKPYTAAELETMRANVRKNLALDTHQGQVRLVQIAAPGDAIYLFDARCVDIRGLAPVFTAPERPVAIFQNGAFDLQLLWQHGIQVPDGSRLWDTMLAAQVAEANADKANEHYGLGDLVQRYLGREIDKEPQGSDWSGPLSSDQLHYAALDAAILLPLYRAQVEQLRADNQLPVVTDIEAPCLPATAWLEWAGLAVDEPGWVDVEAYAREQRDRVKAELDAYVAERLDVEKWHARLRAEGYQNAEILASDTVNWVAPQQTKAALWVMGHPVESTEEDDLAALSDPLLGGHIIAYRKARRRAEAYGRKYLVNMNPVTRRLHPSFLQCRASTGRFSCADPNTQQVPKDPRYRSKFRASAGHCLLDADYNQIELRIIAEITGDTYMLDLFQKGVDLHRLIVHEVFGIPLDQITEEERRKGKAINFGFAYGQYEKGFIARAKAEYGVTFTWEEAHRAREVFLSTYPMIKAWHERYQQPYGAPKVYVDTYTVCGRRRQRVWRFNEKLASPVQGSAADGIKRAMALLYERRHEAPDAVLVNMIHDELLVECDIATHQRAAQWLKQAMVDGMKEVLHILEPVVEIKAYLDWGVTPLANE
jgi:DNA polymerase-1